MHIKSTRYEIEINLFYANINLYKHKTKDFTVHVSGKNNLKEIVMDKLILSYYLTDKDVLPMSISGGTISWESDHNTINPASGIITQPKSGEVEVNLTASVKFDGNDTVQKKFKVKVMGKGTQYILSYTRATDNAPEKTGMYNEYVCDSMHLGLSADGKRYEPLLNNTGVLFAKAQGADTKLLKQPFIFRMKDGNFGILALRVNAEESINDVPGTFILFTSPDLISFNEVGLVKLTDQEQIKNPYCTYDAYRDQYIISWTDASTEISYVSTTSDFKQFSSPNLFSSPRTAPPVSDIQYAVESNALPISQNESIHIINKLKPVTNTTVDDAKISVNAGQKADLANTKVMAHYTDGSSAYKAVNWNQTELAGVNFNIPGTYTVNGTVKQLDDDGTNYPFLKERADPAVVKFNNKYYFIATTESQNIGLYIRESDTLLGIKTAAENLVFDEAKGASAGYVTPDCHWAPELHIINSELCMLFSANQGNGGFNVQSMFMKLKTDGDPKKYDDWETPKRFLDKNGDFLSNNSNRGGITLDMTHFAYNNRHYVIWSQRNFNINGGTADLWIGEIEADKPWQLISDPVLIVLNEYGWERNHTFVNEGPFVIIRDDKLYMTYSGGAVDETYSVGITTVDLNENVDFLDPGTWVKTNYPVLTGFSVPGLDGPGHNSYVMDDDGQFINLYHARIQNGNWTRDTLLRIVHFGANGTPILDMSKEREILASNKNVKLIVTVE